MYSLSFANIGCLNAYIKLSGIYKLNFSLRVTTLLCIRVTNQVIFLRNKCCFVVRFLLTTCNTLPYKNTNILDVATIVTCITTEI
jgi:hypothetical protein